jgi:hypothetical protein
MKKQSKYLVMALAAIFFVAGCSNPFIAPKAAPETEYRSAGDGTGLALIRLEGSQGARTLLPAIVAAEFYYVLAFTPGTGNDAEALTVKVDRSSAKSLELLAGPWNLDVKGYIDAAHAEEAPDDPGLIGSADFTVTAGGEAEVEVTLAAAGQTENGLGEFVYAVSFPANVSIATLHLIDITIPGIQWPVDLLDGAVEADGVKTASGVVPEIPSKFYRLVLDLSVQLDGIPSQTLRTRVVRIHDSLQTKAAESFTEADFFKGRKFDSLTELKNYLGDLDENGVANPYPVALSAAIDLSSAGLLEGGDPLGALYGALTRFVDLDLSEYQGTIIGQTSGYSISVNRPNGPNLVSVTLPPGLTEIGRHAFEGCSNLSSIDLPSGITTIYYNAFMGCASLTSITWPADLTYVGGSAFQNSGLSGSLALPAGLTTFSSASLIFSGTNITSVDLSAMTGLTGIGDSMFQNCKNLREVILPSGLANFTIQARSFEGCESLDTLNWEVFSAGALTVGTYAFAGTAFNSLPSFDIFAANGFSGASYAFSSMLNLTSVDMSGWTGTTLNSMFQDCVNLESFTLSSNVTTIYEGFTAGCLKVRYNAETNANFSVANDNIMLLKDSGATLVAANGATGSVTIPSSVTSIGPNAFQNCTALTEITFSPGLTTIGRDAFLNCGIEVITLPSTLSSLTNGAFNSPSLKTVKIPYNLGLELTARTFSGVAYELLPGGSSGGYEVFAEGKLVVKNNVVCFVTPEFSGALVLPASVISIAGYAFEYSAGLSSVDMSGCTSMITIEADAFNGATLKAVTLPASLTTIDYYAFCDATSLEWVKWPASGVSASIIGDAFIGATKLSRAELPDNLSSIESYAFYDASLQILILRAITPPVLGSNAFPSTDFSIYVPDAKVDDYKGASGWIAFADKIKSINDLGDDDPGNWD